MYFETHWDFESLVMDDDDYYSPIINANDIAQSLGIKEEIDQYINDVVTTPWESFDRPFILKISAIDRLYSFKQWTWINSTESRLLLRIEEDNSTPRWRKYLYVMLSANTFFCQAYVSFLGSVFVTRDVYLLMKLIPWRSDQAVKKDRIYESLARDHIWDEEGSESSIGARKIPATLSYLCHEKVSQIYKTPAQKEYYRSMLPQCLVESLFSFTRKKRLLKDNEILNWVSTID